MSGANCFNDMSTELFPANCTIPNPDNDKTNDLREINGEIYQHLPNNNVCPTKNFTPDATVIPSDDVQNPGGASCDTSMDKRKKNHKIISKSTLIKTNNH